MLFIHFFLQIKQTFCILLDFVVAVAAHLLQKYKKKFMKSRHFWMNAIILIMYIFPIRMYQFGDKSSPNKFTKWNVTSRWIVPQIMILNDATHFLSI